MDDQILDFESIYGPGISVRDFAQSIASRHPHAPPVQVNPVLSDPGDEVFVEAEINVLQLPGFGLSARWIARCPDCPGSEYVTPHDPIFMCCSCWNGGNGGYWLTVRFPENKDEIEFALLKRPARNRNWKPGESLEDLELENAENGVDV